MMLKDKFGVEIKAGHKVVYPARPGGKGPLQLIAAVVEDVYDPLGEVTVIPEGSEKVLAIKRVERLAVING
jgi:hypothetical protein